MLHEAGSAQNSPEHFANTTVGNAKNPFSCMDEISIRSNAPSFTNVAFGVDEDGESFIHKFLQGEIYLLTKPAKASSYVSGSCGILDSSNDCFDDGSSLTEPTFGIVLSLVKNDLYTN